MANFSSRAVSSLFTSTAPTSEIGASLFTDDRGLSVKVPTIAKEKKIFNFG